MIYILSGTEFHKRLACLCGLLSVILAGLASAGQAPLARPLPGRPGPLNAPKEEKKSLEDLRQFQTFTYIGGGRDPFTFRKAAEKADNTVGVKTGRTDTEIKHNVGEITKTDKIKILRETIMTVETLMLQHAYEASVKTCEELRKLVDTEWGGAGKMDPDPEVNDLFRSVLSYERTGKRLHKAREIRKEFESQQILIKGIRWTPTGASVLINEKIYESGGIVKTKGSTAPIQIEVIDEDSVVFIYKGQRFRKSVGTVDPEAGR